MSTATLNTDIDTPLRLRRVVARHGELEAGRWWRPSAAARPIALRGHPVLPPAIEDHIGARGAIAGVLDRGDVTRKGQKRDTRIHAGEP